MRQALLNETKFQNVAHARSLIRDWTADFNEKRPRLALGYQTPKAFAAQLTAAPDIWANLRINPKRSSLNWIKVQSQISPSIRGKCSLPHDVSLIRRFAKTRRIDLPESRCDLRSL